LFGLPNPTATEKNPQFLSTLIGGVPPKAPLLTEKGLFFIMKKPLKNVSIQKTPKNRFPQKICPPAVSPKKGLKKPNPKFFLPFPYRKRLPPKKGAPKKTAWPFRKNSGSLLKTLSSNLSYIIIKSIVLLIVKF
jgi:hypothetical protein